MIKCTKFIYFISITLNVQNYSLELRYIYLTDSFFYIF